MDTELNTQVLTFYGYWQLIVCCFAFLGLMSIWYHMGRKQKDTGQVWLALSILCWSLSGGMEVMFARELNVSESVLTVSKSILSLLNSFFILLALPYFRQLPGLLEGTIKSKLWLPLIGLPFLFSLLPTLSKLVMGSSPKMISELDVYYSILTLLILGWVLWESFMKRKLNFLAYLSILCIAITFVAQVYKLSNNEFSQLLYSAIFKTSLIMIFFALAMSWVKELSESVIPAVGDIFLKFKVEKNSTGRFDHLVQLTGFPGKENQEIRLTPANFNLLHLFAQRKSNPENEWLEIKPKSESRTGKTYDIKDHNEVKRLTQALLDGIFGKQNWTKEQHEAPLKATLFEMSEKRERKIRLKIPASNISIAQ